MDDDSLIQAIRNEPENLTLRLVYCDWLEERSDPRAAYLRLWCELADYPEAEFRGYPTLRIQLGSLARSLPTEWLRAMNADRFYLGIDEVVLLAEQFLKANFPASKRYWFDFADMIATKEGWFITYSPMNAEEDDPPKPYRTLFVDRRYGTVDDLTMNRSNFQRFVLNPRCRNGIGLP